MSPDLFMWVIGGVGALIAIAAGYAERGRRALHDKFEGLADRHDKLKTNLSDYKLEAKDRFASVGHLQEVEGRLEDRLTSLDRSIRELATSIQSLQLTIAASQGVALKSGASCNDG